MAIPIRPALEDVIYPIEMAPSSSDPLLRGWALKNDDRSKTRFSQNVKDYLVEKFQEGLNNNRKLEAKLVAKMMRREKINGEARFQKNEFLKEQQIQSFFTREAKRRREQTQREPQQYLYEPQEVQQQAEEAER